MRSVRVLVIDDSAYSRRTIIKLLEELPGVEVVGYAANGEEGLRKVVDLRPDLITLDLEMPGMDGFGAIRKIFAYDKKARILIFSVYENEIYLRRVLDEGVLGYITKRSAAKVMIEAVRQVAQGKPFIGQEMQSYLVHKKSPSANPVRDTLSPREFEVFLHLAQGKTVNDIAEILNLSSKTVGHHYTHIKNKLNVASVAELTRIAIRERLLEP